MAGAAAIGTDSADLRDAAYTVYSVDQGDRMTLVSTVDGEPEFRPVMLSFINCPKVGRRQASGELSEDDPCAYDAMEFVRARVLGKQVRFTDHFYVAPLKRFAGAMTLQDGTDITIELLKAGLAKIPVRLPPKMDKEMHADFLAAQTIARNAKRGVHAPDAEERQRLVLPHPPEDHEGFAEALYHKEMKVRVDRVVSGTGLLLHVANPEDELEFQAIQAVLTGAQANHTIDRYGGQDTMGQSAKLHTERLLLHRHPKVRFEGLDANGNFLVTVKSSKGTFQEELLSKGFARVNKATVSEFENPEVLHEAEKQARVDGVGIWGSGPAGEGKQEGAAAAGEEGKVVVVSSGKREEPTADGKPAPAKPAVEFKGEAAFEGVVVQIVNGDTMVVRKDNGEQTKVSLAGVRANKISTRDNEQRGGQRPPESRVSHEEYTWEAREFLRTTCIGQRVKVIVEYARVMDGDAKEVRAMATVLDKDSGVNVGAAVLRKGLAKFFLGRDDVCSRENELRNAEQEALAEGLNIHSKQQAPSTKITELNRAGEKLGRHWLGFLQRGMQGRKPPVLRAIVEFVLSGSSFRVYVPREHCAFSLRLAGIVTPSNQTGSNDPFADESRDFAICTLQQREVEIMVETVDRGGNFIGYLIHRGKNFGQTILAQGLATCSGADRTLFPHEFAVAEKQAQEAKRNIWSDKGAVPAMAQKRAAQQAARMAVKTAYAKPDGEQEWVDVNVTNVEDAATVSINYVTEEVEEQRALVGPLVDAIGADEGVKRHQPVKGELVIVLFREDKQWYRGKVQDVFVGDKRADVLFIDYGNVVESSFKDIRPIPSVSDYEPLRKVPGFAKQVKLAYVLHRDDTAQYVDDAVATAWEYIGDVTVNFVARLEYTSDNGNVKYMTIATQPGALSLQEKLLREGYAYVNRDLVSVDAAAVTKHLKEQEVARKQHLGIWEHGDFENDEE